MNDRPGTAPGREAVPPLHEMQPTRRFSDRAADYSRYRPDYPAAAIDAVLQGLGPPERVRAADVGAGTGISARLLAARGVSVIAIEPNAEMRAQAEPDARVAWSVGTAEATGLDPGSQDLVLCAQAFHWFHPAEAVAEFARVLRPGGRLALVWNSRDRRDPLTLGYVEAIHAVQGEDPVELRPFDPAVVSTAGDFAPVERVDFPHVQELDEAGLLGRAMSASYVPKEGPRADRLRALLAELYARHRDAEGTVRMRYVTRVYRARRLSATGR